MISCQMCKQDTSYQVNPRGGNTCEHCESWINASGALLVECRVCSKPVVDTGPDICGLCAKAERKAECKERQALEKSMVLVRDLRINVLQDEQGGLYLEVSGDRQTLQELTGDEYMPQRWLKNLAYRMLDSQASQPKVLEDYRVFRLACCHHAGHIHKSHQVSSGRLVIALAVASSVVDSLQESAEEKAEEAHQGAQENQVEVSS